MRVSAIVEARLGSKRLPGKVLKEVDGIPLICWMLRRVLMAELIDTVVVATPDTLENAPLWQIVQNGTPAKLVTGSEDDVLSRVLKAARETKTDVIVELTGDCPLIDPRLIDMCTGYLICGKWDFVGNVQPRSYPRGMDVRVFRTETLERVNEEVKGNATEAYWREHVSPWMYDRTGSEYKCLNLDAEEGIIYPDLNLSVDTEEDFRRIEGILKDIGTKNPGFTCKDAIQYLAALPGYEMLLEPQLIKEIEWQQS